jgi:predicted restriction endonuclease
MPNVRKEKMKPDSDLPYIDDPSVLSAELRRLYASRQSVKKTEQRIPRNKISHEDKIAILEKTDFRCHICGQEVTEKNFHADHISAHSKGGDNNINNYLASCSFCNSYRWDYLSDEMKWILKIGVWVKTQIEFETDLGKEITQLFVEYEKKRESRRKQPREGLSLNVTDYPVREKIDFTNRQRYEKRGKNSNN